MGFCLSKSSTGTENERLVVSQSVPYGADDKSQGSTLAGQKPVEAAAPVQAKIPGFVEAESVAKPSVPAADDSSVPSAFMPHVPGVFKEGDRVAIDGAFGVIKSGPDDEEEFLIDWDSGETSSFHTVPDMQHEWEALQSPPKQDTIAETGDPSGASAENATVADEDAAVQHQAAVAEPQSDPAVPQEPTAEEPPAAPECGAESPKNAEPTWEQLIERGAVRPDLSWFEAAAGDEAQTLAWLLSSGTHARVDLTDDDKATALHVAAKAGAQKCCELLLKRKADPNAQDKFRDTPLHHAALGGDLSVTKMLLDPSELLKEDGLGAEGNKMAFDSWPGVLTADVWKRTPIHKAAEGGNPEVIKLLLDERASLEKADREGETVLHMAVGGGHDDAVKLLLERSGGQLALDATNKDECSALDLCVAKRRVVSGDILVAAGAKLYKDVRKTPPTLLGAVRDDLPFLCTYVIRSAPAVGATSVKALMTTADDSGFLPIGLAARNGSVEVMQRLLDGTADVAAVQPNSKQAIHEAADAGRREAIEFLLQHGVKADAVDKDGQTMLFHAAASGHATVCDWILDEGRGGCLASETLTFTDSRERTALHSAAQGGHVLSCECLLRRADVECADLLQAEDWEGFTAAHLAVQAGKVDVCCLLVSKKATLYAALDYGVTTLQTAVEGGHSDVLELLLEELKAGVSPDAPNVEAAITAKRTSDGRNAWLLATAEGHAECCRKLWAASGAADVGESVDRDGRDALMLAARGGHVDLCTWLSDNKVSSSLLVHKDACGWTALHVAASEGQKQAVEWLLKAGADLKAVDEDGLTAHDWAGKRGHVATEACLRDALKAADT